MTKRDSEVAAFARGQRWGYLQQYLCSARDALALADSFRDLVSLEDRGELEALRDILAGVCQRAQQRMDAERMGKR